ncbi:MAG: hypothetical protein FWE21_02120 [Defluviitaleaceae bacterium]|nr:hypothetical protein [Defluviitaleaceae bacterium]
MVDLYGFKTHEKPKEREVAISPLQAFEEFSACPTPVQPRPGVPNYGADALPNFLPPSHTPSRPAAKDFVDAGTMEGNMHRATYLWLTDGQQFWFCPTFLGKHSVAGYRWENGQWMYTGFGLDAVESLAGT